jgi:uncharacterized phiE125 gp8 family phage protein
MSLRPAVPLTQYRGHALVTAPVVDPVTAAELRTHLGFASDDTTGIPTTDAEAFITDARQIIEEYTGIAMINQSWRLVLDDWPYGREPWWDGVRQFSRTELYSQATMRSIFPPRYPLASITSCTVYDEASNSSAVTVADTFDIDTYSKPGRLTLKSGATWPVALRTSNAIEIVYVAGFGAAAVNVPGPLKRAVRQLAAYMYEHRGDACSAEDAMSKSGASLLINAYKVARL